MKLKKIIVKKNTKIDETLTLIKGEVDYVLGVLPKIVDELREMSPLWAK